MKLTISSSLTFMYKAIFPAVMLGGFGIGFMVILFSTGSPLQALPLIVIMALVAALLYWLTMGLKKVAMDDQYLYISNFRREIRVRRDQIAGVTENRWINIHPVTVRFRAPTEFGDKIVFMPTVRLFAGFSPHPIVGELRSTIPQSQ
jgi:hypothetical protein